MHGTTLAYEKENKRKGMRKSAIVHGILMLIVFFWVLPDDPDKNIDTQYAVTVAFDNSVSSNSENMKSSSGKKRPETPEFKKIVSTPKKKVTPVKPKPQPKPTIKPTTPQPKPSKPIISPTTEPESPVVAVDSEIEVDDPEPDVYEPPTPVEIPTTTPEVVEDSTPTLDEILADLDEPEASDDGAPADFESELDEAGGPDSDGETDDPGAGTGDAGDGQGDGDSGDDLDDGIGSGGTGDGEYDDSGRGIFGRRVVKRNNLALARTVSGKTGKFVFKVCVSPSGDVTHVEINEFLTTIKSKSTIRKAMKIMWGYKYEVDPSAPGEECGKFTFNIDNFQGFGGM